MYIMRDKKTHRPLALGFSIEGLQFTTDDKGRYIYFRKRNRPVVKNGRLQFEGDVSISDKVYIEQYSRKNHIDRNLKRAERLFALKARQYGV